MSVNNGLCVGQPPRFFLPVRLCLNLCIWNKGGLIIQLSTVVGSQRISNHSNFLFFVLSWSPNQMHDRLPLNNLCTLLFLSLNHLNKYFISIFLTGKERNIYWPRDRLYGIYRVFSQRKRIMLWQYMQTCKLVWNTSGQSPEKVMVPRLWAGG